MVVVVMEVVVEGGRGRQYHLGMVLNLGGGRLVNCLESSGTDLWI